MQPTHHLTYILPTPSPADTFLRNSIRTRPPSFLPSLTAMGFRTAVSEIGSQRPRGMDRASVEHPRDFSSTVATMRSPSQGAFAHPL